MERESRKRLAPGASSARVPRSFLFPCPGSIFPLPQGPSRSHEASFQEPVPIVLFSTREPSVRSSAARGTPSLAGRVLPGRTLLYRVLGVMPSGTTEGPWPGPVLPFGGVRREGSSSSGVLVTKGRVLRPGLLRPFRCAGRHTNTACPCRHEEARRLRWGGCMGTSQSPPVHARRNPKVPCPVACAARHPTLRSGDYHLWRMPQTAVPSSRGPFDP